MDLVIKERSLVVRRQSGCLDSKPAEVSLPMPLLTKSWRSNLSATCKNLVEVN
jgi:hypothetical protein